MNISMDIARHVLASQPFSTLLGTRVTGFAPGHSELRIPIRDELKQQNGFVHGGVLSYAADNGLTFAGGSVLGSAVVTSEFKINYVRPALGDELVARASVVHAGKSQAVCRCEVFCVSAGSETLCAIAQGTIVSLPRDSRDDL
ncbi:PaaI family thioesterase [Dokdonella sp.]|uniref:PaaI family thioesterase n=1 Tax=Dokdonella sp. TaxID=2291710 RepID=UPI003528C881